MPLTLYRQRRVEVSSIYIGADEASEFDDFRIAAKVALHRGLLVKVSITLDAT